MLSLTLFAAILLVFYLYLLIHPEKMRRANFCWLGAAGVLLVVMMNFFTIWLGSTWAMVLITVFSTIGTVVAFVFAFMACCICDKLPEDAQRCQPEPPEPKPAGE